LADFAPPAFRTGAAGFFLRAGAVARCFRGADFFVAFVLDVFFFTFLVPF
jgi:hypothetical protein